MSLSVWRSPRLSQTNPAEAAGPLPDHALGLRHPGKLPVTPLEGNTPAPDRCELVPGSICRGGPFASLTMPVSLIMGVSLLRRAAFLQALGTAPRGLRRIWMSHGFLSMCATAEEKGGQTDRPAACSAGQTDFVPQGRTEAGEESV